MPWRRLSCQAKSQGDVVIDVRPDSQVDKRVMGACRGTPDRARTAGPPLLRRGTRKPDMPCAPGRPAYPLAAGLGDPVGAGRRPCICSSFAERAEGVLREGRWKVTATVTRRRWSYRIIAVAGYHDTAPAALRSTSARPRSPPTSALSSATSRVVRRDQPADPLRRGPDEPGLLRHDEPRRRRDDRRRARGDRCADREGRRAGASSRATSWS